MQSKEQIMAMAEDAQTALNIPCTCKNGSLERLECASDMRAIGYVRHALMWAAGEAEEGPSLRGLREHATAWRLKNANEKADDPIIGQVKADQPAKADKGSPGKPPGETIDLSSFGWGPGLKAKGCDVARFVSTHGREVIGLRFHMADDSLMTPVVIDKSAVITFIGDILKVSGIPHVKIEQ